MKRKSRLLWSRGPWPLSVRCPPLVKTRRCGFLEQSFLKFQLLSYLIPDPSPQGSSPKMTAESNCRYEVEWVTEYACHRDYLESHGCKLNSEQHDMSIDLTPLTLSGKPVPPPLPSDWTPPVDVTAVTVCSLSLGSSLQRAVWDQRRGRKLHLLSERVRGSSHPRMWRRQVRVLLPGEGDRRHAEGGWEIPEPDPAVTSDLSFLHFCPRSGPRCLTVVPFLSSISSFIPRYSDGDLILIYPGGSRCSSGFERMTIINFECNKTACEDVFSELYCFISKVGAPRW